MDIDEPLLDLDVEQDEEPDSPVKRKRGRPSISKKAAKKQSTTSTPPPVADEVDSQSDTWKEISGDNDTRKYNFRFVPDREPGVHADLDEGSTPLDCFFELFDDDIQDELVTFINEYAAHKLATVFPATKGSRFKSWTPMSKYELLKFLAVITAMGIDKRPCLEDYWSLDSYKYTPWYGEQFSRNRFEIIYSSMMHASNVFILYCLTRAAGTKATSLKSFKQMLIKELLAKANEIIPENHKHHIVAKPDAKLKRVPGPSHLVTWVPDDRNCKFCSTPKDRKRTHFFCQ